MCRRLLVTSASVTLILIHAGAQAQTDPEPSTFMPTQDSIAQHEVPAWFHDAKFGIFVHWTMSCIPAFAPRTGTLVDVIREHPMEVAKYVPYAEWYWNAQKFPDSPTAQYHRETYGENYPYENFRAPFEAGLNAWDPDSLAELAEAAGAKYLVLVTKHHDGFCLWPTDIDNPHKPGWHSDRDIVGELAEAVRARGMRFGVYYSGGLDWTFHPEPIASAGDMFRSVPTTEEYRAYAVDHFRELIDRYRPSILWNDIAYPPGPELLELFAYYYNTVPEGVVNDRWSQPTERWANAPALFLPEPPPHSDFRTTEYTQLPSISERKWEATRGIGHSFGYTKNEDPNDILSLDELIRSFVDGASKNGNLLLNVGPKPDGSITPSHAALLRDFGAWLSRNGAAIYGTRPWLRAEGMASDGDGNAVSVRFTARDDTVFAIMLDAARQVEIAWDESTPIESIRSVGEDELSWSLKDGTLTLRMSTAPNQAYAVAITLTN